MIEDLFQTILGTSAILVLMSIFAATVQEMSAAVGGSRGQFLKLGLRKLLPDQPIFRRVMQHPLISGLYRDQAALDRPPSYLAPANFANALLDVLRVRATLAEWTGAGNDVDDLRLAAEKLQLDHPVIGQSLIPILHRAEGDYAAAMSGVEQWYCSGMDQVSHWYLNYVRKRLFVIGLVLAALLNVDAINVVRSFWNVADAPAPVASITVTDEGTKLLPANQWPIGYSCLAGEGAGIAKRVTSCAEAARDYGGREDRFFVALLTLFGWLLTAFAISATAPVLFRVFRFRRSRAAHP